MIKQYFSDGLLQIAIILSLFRTDLNSFYVPNNELLNYPEVQDILQGQTMAYLPTSFHNQYNTLNSIGGYPHPKHVESDFYFSSLFRELRALSGFRQVSTNIEAFLVSDSTVGFPPVQTASSGPLPTTSADANNNAVGGNGASTAAAQANVEGVLQSIESVDNNLSAVGGVVNIADFNNNVTFHCPFPGCDLTKEDLDLIDVLWRQDVDLGVGKEVFDPNLRRELERERELEFRKETEKRKEAEKRQKDRQQQAHQWLTQNFMRDGETGEWVPIAGPDNTQFSPSGQQSTGYPEQAEPDFTLDDALEYINQYNGGTTSEQQHLQHPQGQQFDLTSPLLPSNQNLTAPPSETFDADSLIVEAEKFSGFTNLNNNQSDQERLEQNWQELVSLLNETEVNATASNTTTTMPPVDTQTLLQQPPTSTMNEMHMYQQQQMNGNLNLNLNNSSQYSEHGFSLASTSMNETCMLLQQNSSLAESVLMGDGGMLLQNATLPCPMDNVSLIVDSKSLVNDSGLHCASPHYNATAPDQDTLSPLDWEVGELFFPNVSGLTNLSSAIASATMLDSSDILPEFLPDEDLDMALNEGLQSIQVLDDGGSDSAVSMGSGSPKQEVNDTMELSHIDGLEGATGGSDYDHTTTYSHHQETRTRSTSGSMEDEGFHYSCSSYGSPASVSTNCSTGSNDTERSSSLSATATSHVHHNHTYPTQPGQVPREVKKYAKKDGPRQKGPASRDMKKAQELKIPFTYERIIEAPVEEFNDMMTKTKLTEQQMALMRDIRRRGKNKVAAQNCRKRKLNVLYNLEDDMGELQRTRDKLMHERRQIDLQTRQTKDKYSALYDHIFRSLRDEQGRPYDPNEYSLQQSSDGNVFLVPKNGSTAISTPSSSSSGKATNKRVSPGNNANKDKDRSEQKKKSRE